MKGDLTVRVMALGISVIILLSLVGCGSTSSGGDEGTPLLEFCDSKELNAWYEGLDDNPPVSLEYLVYGESVETLEIDDPGLILRAAKSIATVRIGDAVKGDESPRNTSDAPGTSYSFEMEDGTKRDFTFMMDCFEYGNIYYKVESYGDLSVIDTRLYGRLNPTMVTIRPSDESFYIFCLSSWDWKDEGNDGFNGGIYLYPYGEDSMPYIVVRQFDEGTIDFDSFDEEYEEYLSRTVTDKGIEIDSTTEIRQDRLGDDALIQFVTVRDGSDTGQAGKISQDLADVMDSFHLVHKQYEMHDVEPGNKLLDFLNDDYVRDIFSYISETDGNSLSYVQGDSEGDKHRGYTKDARTVLSVLKALETVEIGENLGSTPDDERGYRHFSFSLREGGIIVEFTFYEDYIRLDDNYGDSCYAVTDWGTLNDLGLTIVDDGNTLTMAD